MVEVQCLNCLAITRPDKPDASSWDCACGRSYVLRRCSSCGVVSQVRSLQRKGDPWACQWCKAANSGYTPRNDPATATLTDLASDMASHGLTLIRRAPEAPPRDTQPVLIVTTNDIPGYRIIQVHGDVSG